MRERTYLAFVERFPLTSDRASSRAMCAAQSAVRRGRRRVVGWCDIRRETIAVYAHVGHLGMGVASAYRGRGIGERLIARRSTQRARRLRAIELSCTRRNARAAALYRKVGFVLEGTRVRGSKLDGEYDDVHMMELLL